MSGSFQDIDVPPTLVSFAVDVANGSDVVTPELKSAGNKLVAIEISKDEYDLLYKRYQNKQVLETFKKKKDIYECVSPIPD